MKSFLTLLLALGLAAPALHAEQLFVLFDGTCGDRITYAQTTAQQQRTDYFVYHFAYEGGDHLLLETGNEGGTLQNYLPQNYLYCGNPNLSANLAGAVNDPNHQVYILLPTANNQYLIHPVQRAAVLRERGNVFTYQSLLSGYQFDTENGIIGENLATEGNNAKVYFEGRESGPCGGSFLFRQLKPRATYPVIDYKISPSIGILERHLGQDGVNNSGGSIVAQLVNGIPVRNHLQTICQPQVAQVQPAQPQAYGTQQPVPVNPAVVYQPTGNVNPGVQPESQAYQTTSPPTTSTQQVTHTVTKGETLYAVARKYGSNVDAIKAQNGLTSNTVFPGQRLTVTTSAMTAANPIGNNRGNATALNPTVPTVPYNPGSVAASNPGAAQPTPYGTVATPSAYGSQQVSRGQTAVYGEDTHTVQPGETVASIALKYGYTSAKFREMNELGPNEVVRVGERLKTTACNCPAAPAPATPLSTAGQPAEVAPSAYGTTAPAPPQAYGQPAATNVPPAYGQPAPAAQPQGYGTSAPAQPQPYGQPANQQPAYRAPAGYQAPAGQSPVPAGTTPRPATPAEITNSPNFGQVVPNAAAPPTATMGQLEGRTAGQPKGTATPNPATYNSYPAPATAPATAPPSTYTAPQPVPSAYGTPVGATAPATAAPAATNRAFHLVQEGDSLYSIARRYGLTTDQLRQLNRLDSGSVIVPFQKLYVN